MKGRTFRTVSLTIFCIYLASVALICFMKPSSLPDIGIRKFLGIPIDKCLHFLMFLPYPVLSGMAFIERYNSLGHNLTILAILIIIGIGISYGTEYIQSLTGYRSYETADFYADISGLSAGGISVAAYLIYTKLKK